jgi:hypothetical protein
MSARALKQFLDLQEQVTRPQCWTIVYTNTIGSGIKNKCWQEEMYVFHSIKRAERMYDRMIVNTDNAYTKKNLRIVSRPLEFGEGLYV